MVGVVDASVGQGAISGAGTGVGAGAAVGAAVGSVVPGVGTAVGAVVGGIIGGVAGMFGGGAGGFLSGGKKKKAGQYAKLAAAIQKKRDDEAYRQNLLSQIRNARIQRASSMASLVAAGAEEGSGAQGALSSIGSQTANVVEYMSVDRGRAVLAAAYGAKAQKNASTAQAIDKTTAGLLDLGASIAKAYAAGKSAEKPPIEQPQTETYLSGGLPYLDSNLNVQYVPQGQIMKIG